MNGGSIPELVLIEDNFDDEMLSLRGISRSGVPCHVTVLRDGAEALDYLLAARDVPKLILLDFKLPKLDGLQVLTRLREDIRMRFVSIVIVSGTNCGSTLSECYRAGANSCVRKPDDPNEYVDCLATITRYWLTMNEPAEVSDAEHWTLRNPEIATPGKLAGMPIGHTIQA